MAKIKAFENFSKDYEDWFIKHPKVYEAEIEAIKKLITPFEEAIEIGVGSGRFALPFGIKKGIEPSYKMAEIARSKGIEVTEGVAEKLPFDENSFDFILMVTTICFVDDPLKAIKEIYRTLKDGGFCIIGFVDKESNIGRVYKKNRQKSRFYKEATFFSITEIIELLKKVGLHNIECSQTLFGESIENAQTSVKSGYGEGAFIALRAEKPVEFSLLDLNCGEKALIKRLAGGKEFKRKLASLNIRVGKPIKKITKQPFHGPVVIEIDNTQATIGMNTAKKILLESLEAE